MRRTSRLHVRPMHINTNRREEIVWLSVVLLAAAVAGGYSLLQSEDESGTTAQRKDVPPILSDIPVAPQLGPAPSSCGEFTRPPNVLAYCEYESVAADHDIEQFYRDSMGRSGWMPRDAQSVHPQALTRDALYALNVFSRKDRWLIVERMAGSAVPNARYRITYTSLKRSGDMGAQ